MLEALGGLVVVVIVLLAGAGVIVLIRMAKEERQKAEIRSKTEKYHQALIDETRQLVREHAQPLCRQYRSKAYKDAYGRLALEDWNREVDYFVEKIVLPELSAKGLIDAFLDSRYWLHATGGIGFVGEIEEILAEVVHAEFIALAEQGEIDLVANDCNGGGDFERLCTDCLEQAGWSVTQRGGAGDQGIDLVACKGRTSIGLQCKFHNRPVSNEAVQQAYTGAQILGLPLAAVVSTSGYTPGARTAAQATGVLLLTPEDLPTLGLSAKSTASEP